MFIVVTAEHAPSAIDAVESVKIGKNVFEELSDLKKNLSAVKLKIDVSCSFYLC